MNDKINLSEKLTISNSVKESLPDELFLARNIPLICKYLLIWKWKTNKLHTLKIDKSLSQILVPFNKIDTLIDWYNETIRFETTIPKAFNSGYIILESKFINKSYDRK